MAHNNCIGTIGESSLSLSWRGWVEDGKRLLVADATRLWVILAKWDQRERERHHLAQMDDRMLADMGLTRADALREVQKPFWKP